MKVCVHCWHYTSGYTDGMAVAGKDTFRCCYCGEFVTKSWTVVPDPQHGAWVDTRIKRYDGGWSSNQLPPRQPDMVTKRGRQ